MLACIAHQPHTRIRDIVHHTGLTERTVTRIVCELTQAGYLTKHRLGPRNHYDVHLQQPVRGAEDGYHIGGLLDLILAPRTTHPGDGYTPPTPPNVPPVTHPALAHETQPALATGPDAA